MFEGIWRIQLKKRMKKQSMTFSHGRWEKPGENSSLIF